MTDKSIDKKMLEIGERDPLQTLLIAESAIWYVCFGGPLPSGYPGGGTVESNGVFYSVKVGCAIDEFGTGTTPLDNYAQAKFVTFDVTPLGGKASDPHVVATIQDECLAQLKRMLDDPEIPLYDTSGHDIDFEDNGAADDAAWVEEQERAACTQEES
jgi:hypothetical protein